MVAGSKFSTAVKQTWRGIKAGQLTATPCCHRGGCFLLFFILLWWERSTMLLFKIVYSMPPTVSAAFFDPPHLLPRRRRRPSHHHLPLPQLLPGVGRLDPISARFLLGSTRSPILFSLSDDAALCLLASDSDLPPNVSFLALALAIECPRSLRPQLRSPRLPLPPLLRP